MADTEKQPETPTEIHTHIEQHSWSMGLTGIWKTMSNVAAVTLVCVLFYILVMNLSSNVKEERELFRQEMKLARDANTKEWDAIHASERATRELAEMVRKNQLTVVQVMDQVRETQKGVIELATVFRDNRKDSIALSNSVKELTKQVEQLKLSMKKKE